MFNRRALQSAVGSALPALRDWTSDRSGGAGTRRKGGRLDTALRDAESDSRSGHGGGFGGGFIRSFGREARRSYGDGGDYEDDDDDDEDIGIGREREGDRRRKETDAEGGEEKKDEVEMRHVVGLIGEKAYVLISHLLTSYRVFVSFLCSVSRRYDRLRAWASTMTARLPSYLRFEVSTPFIFFVRIRDKYALIEPRLRFVSFCFFTSSPILNLRSSMPIPIHHSLLTFTFQNLRLLHSIHNQFPSSERWSLFRVLCCPLRS